MLELDLQRAILITYSGLGAAFAVLAFLIVFTILIRLMEHLPNRSGVAKAASEIEPGTDGHQEVPMITADGPTEDGANGAGPNGIGAAAMVDDWKSYGRLEALLSRMSRGRGN